MYIAFPSLRMGGKDTMVMMMMMGVSEVRQVGVDDKVLAGGLLTMECPL